MIKVRVTTHSGEDDILEVESFDAEELTRQRNDDSIQAIMIGNASYSKIDLKNVKPIPVESVE